ncbi:hypothetical protein [Ruixingdingia sedimenti]|uniref:Uncharacterized protein n=1 Tax=Ruixingdingia sedimenti TaxID=3073604 RepID=A0ABU1F7I4_9RHOB|nr:hypothetical protein [Xinfangfangia sp. LG-4]MDR5652834.1 hypothetical protein [Xinfangfangia sp. LG-4]
MPGPGGGTMLEHLPPEIAEGFARARRLERAGGKRLRLQVGGAVFPILRLWHDGFSLDAARVPQRLRGFVEVHEGPNLLLTCLIVASEIEAGELICTFKRATAAADAPAADYWRGESPPRKLLSLLPRL